MFYVCLIITLQLLLTENAFAYLDPSTGSYIFQALIAVFVGAIFTIKLYWQKIKGFFANHLSKKK